MGGSQGGVSVLGGSRLQSQWRRGVPAAAGVGTGLPQHGSSRAAPAAAGTPEARAHVGMELPSCRGPAARSRGREAPGKCFALRTGACKAKEISERKALTETLPPFLSQRLLGRCCRIWPCCGQRPAGPGGKRGAALTPSSARRHRARRAALLRATSAWLGAGAPGRWALRGSALPRPLGPLGPLGSPGRAPRPAGCRAAPCSHVRLRRCTRHATLLPNPSAASHFPGGGGERGQTGRVRGRGREAGEGNAGGDAGVIGRGTPMLWLTIFLLAQQRHIIPRSPPAAPPWQRLVKNRGETRPRRTLPARPPPPRSSGTGRLRL